MIYFDNAATGGFKPSAVVDNVNTVIKYLSANPGRSGHRLSLTGAKIVYGCREVIAKDVNTTEEKIIFTKNCTEGLNTAIFGSLKIGGHVITTVYEHNSVLRPLSYLQSKDLIKLDIVSPKSDDIVSAIEEKITPETYLIVTTAASNVTGKTLPVKKIGALSKEKGILYLVDMAQSGGHIKFDMEKDGISYASFAGHKGLYGIMGSGVLAINKNCDLSPFIMGGTGNESFNLNQPLCYPERLESGTLNLPAIASLSEGAKYAFINRENFSKSLLNMTDYVIEELKKIENVKVYSEKNVCGIVAFSLTDASSENVADILNKDYDIAVRGGLHCAPLMHAYLGTDKTGLIRVSLAPQNSSREIYTFLRAIKEIVKR